MEWSGIKRCTVEGSGVESFRMVFSEEEWNGAEWNKMEWNVMDPNRIQWSGMEWNGME